MSFIYRGVVLSSEVKMYNKDTDIVPNVKYLSLFSTDRGGSDSRETPGAAALVSPLLSHLLSPQPCL